MLTSRIATVVSIFGSILLTACQPSTLDFRNAQISNGKIYEGSSNTPFNGKITNFPSEKIFPGQHGFQKFADTIGNIVAGNEGAALKNLGIPMAVPLSRNFLCDSTTEDGILDGSILCKEKGSNNTAIEGKFKGGVLNGDMKLYATLGQGKKYRATVSFSDGLPNGKQEIYSEISNKKVSAFHWSKGVADGEEERFDEQTGTRTLVVNYTNGKYDGEYSLYSADGKQIGKGAYQNGILLFEETFDPQTGKMTGHAEYKNGQLQGVVKQWDANGNLVLEKTFDNGVEVGSSKVAAPLVSVDSCVDKWIAAFRKENGNEALVNHDQIEEWESWCKEGKQPS